MTDLSRLRDVTEDDVKAALACSYVAELSEIEPAKLVELYHCVLDQVIGPRGEDD